MQCHFMKFHACSVNLKRTFCSPLLANWDALRSAQNHDVPQMCQCAAMLPGDMYFRVISGGMFSSAACYEIN